MRAVNRFLEINPNGRIPALTDKYTDGKTIRLFESGGIMLYLAERYDTQHKLTFPAGSREHFEMLNWLFFMNAGVGPMQGQSNHFTRYAPTQIEYGINRYQNETRRLYGVLEAHLAATNADYLVGNKCSLADIAHWGWISAAGWAGIDITAFPRLQAWEERMWARPALQKGANVPDPYRMKEILADKQKAEQMAAGAREWIQQVASDKLSRNRCLCEMLLPEPTYHQIRRYGTAQVAPVRQGQTLPWSRLNATCDPISLGPAEVARCSGSPRGRKGTTQPHRFYFWLTADQHHLVISNAANLAVWSKVRPDRTKPSMTVATIDRKHLMRMNSAFPVNLNVCKSVPHQSAPDPRAKLHRCRTLPADWKSGRGSPRPNSDCAHEVDRAGERIGTTVRLRATLDRPGIAGGALLSACTTTPPAVEGPGGDVVVGLTSHGCCY
nr:disulfide-bond oxidoreductase yfcg [Quercus suber]